MPKHLHRAGKQSLSIGKGKNLIIVSWVKSEWKKMEFPEDSHMRTSLFLKVYITHEKRKKVWIEISVKVSEIHTYLKSLHPYTEHLRYI